MRVKCPYCDKDAKLVFGNKIYPHRYDLYDKKFYMCSPCRAWVGCHPSSDKPLGRLANAELRKAKQTAHAMFDPIWKQGAMTRTAAYSWLANEIGVAPQNCHIGMFDLHQCEAVVRACTERKS